MVLWILLWRSWFHLRGFHPLWPAFPGPFCYLFLSSLQSEPRSARTSGWAPPVSLAATPDIDFSFFSSGYLDVSVHRVPSACLSGLPLLQHTVTGVFPAGFPHSDICGSLLICSSPQLFAAYHVFLRPFVPRHPPCALLCLTFLPSVFPSGSLPSAPSVALSGFWFIASSDSSCCFTACFLPMLCFTSLGYSWFSMLSISFYKLD